MTLKHHTCISVIIPVYNVERYLRDCLDSVVNQSLQDIEIICVNDGSEDGSLAILNEFAEKDSRVIVINKENEGQAAARNLALSCASGKYIAFVDSDDLVDRDLFTKAFGVAEKRQSDVVMFDFSIFRSGAPCDIRPAQPSVLINLQDSDKIALLRQQGVVWTKLVRRNFMESKGITFPEGLIYEDILVHWKLLTLSENVAILPERLYRYRVHPLATTSRVDWKLTDRLLIYDLLKAFLMQNRLYECYRDFFLQQQLEMFCWLYDIIADSERGKAMTLIQDRLGEEHWQYIHSGKPLHWKTRALFLALSGSILSRFRRSLWLTMRICYRKLKCYTPHIQ